MTDMAFTDMEPFLNGHDRRARRIFIAMTAISLLVSVAGLTYGVLNLGSLGAIPGRLWFPILFYPLPILFLWIASVSMARKRVRQPDGSVPMNPDDARSTARVANAGTVFVAGASVVCIASQLGMVLNTFDAVPSMKGWLYRAIIVAIGALMVYFGNAWPMMPTPRAPEQKPAMQRKFNRIYGWMVVIHGLLFVGAGLLLPNPVMFAAGAGVISLSTLLFAVTWMLMYRRAVRSPSAA